MACVKYLFVLLLLWSTNGVYPGVLEPITESKELDKISEMLETDIKTEGSEVKAEAQTQGGGSVNPDADDDTDVSNEGVVKETAEKKSDDKSSDENRVDPAETNPGFDPSIFEDPVEERPLEQDVGLGLRLSMSQNVSDLCQYLNLDNCEGTLNDAEADETVDEHGDKIAVSGVDRNGPKWATFAMCNPRMQTIALPRHPDLAITAWPTCTMAMRCGGCCTSDMFSCEPTETKKTVIKVFDTKLPYPGAQRFIFLGMRNVQIIEHTQCDAMCKTKEDQCHPNQMYEARKCRCVCRPERMIWRYSCNKNQIWDNNECDCICPNRATANCPEPSYFSQTTCKCTLKTSVTGEIDLDKLIEKLKEGGLLDDDVDDDTDGFFEDMLGFGGTNDNKKQKPRVTTTTEEPTTTTTATTTTTPTTTTTTTTPAPTKDPCASVICFGSWQARLLGNNRCQCMPPFRFQG